MNAQYYTLKTVGTRELLCQKEILFFFGCEVKGMIEPRLTILEQSKNGNVLIEVIQ